MSQKAPSARIRPASGISTRTGTSGRSARPWRSARRMAPGSSTCSSTWRIATASTDARSVSASYASATRVTLRVEPAEAPRVDRRVHGQHVAGSRSGQQAAEVATSRADLEDGATPEVPGVDPALGEPARVVEEGGREGLRVLVAGAVGHVLLPEAPVGHRPAAAAQHDRQGAGGDRDRLVPAVHDQAAVHRDAGHVVQQLAPGTPADGTGSCVEQVRRRSRQGRASPSR